MAKEKKADENQAATDAAAPAEKSRPESKGAPAPADPAKKDPAADATAAGALDEDGAGKDVKRARVKAARTVSSGVVHIQSSFNNTMVSITDPKGNVLAWSSSGRMGFRGARKSTAYAATVVTQDAVRQVQAYRLQEVEVRVQGPGAGRESAIRALQGAGLAVTLICDVTPIPHNGCRPRKRRRV